MYMNIFYYVNISFKCLYTHILIYLYINFKIIKKYIKSINYKFNAGTIHKLLH